MKPYIQLRNIHKTFGAKNVLAGIDLDINQGSSLVIIGRSGTGKSVLIKAMLGIIKADKGSVNIEGVDFFKASNSEKEKLLANCGFLFQGGALFDSLNVEDNITFKLKDKLTKQQKSELAASKLNAVGLKGEILKSYPCELSGGMMKRVALARAICTDPRLIIFDEPTTGLDPIMSNIINDLINQIRENLKATTITITHDINSVKQIATDIAMIDEGKIIWQGSKNEMQKTDDPYLNQFINGEIQGPLS